MSERQDAEIKPRWDLHEEAAPLRRADGAAGPAWRKRVGQASTVRGLRPVCAYGGLLYWLA